MALATGKSVEVTVRWHTYDLPAQYTSVITLVQGYSSRDNIPRIIQANYGIQAQFVRIDNITGDENVEWTKQNVAD